MSKPFQFKQFKIEQAEVAMKVGTDGVLLGAWANIAQAHSILDIGTGTGLLALMCAQRNHTAAITAIDVNALAYQQAKQNCENSQWANRIHVLQADVKQFAQTTSKLFDAILCNPPYFKATATTINVDRLQARQQEDLTIKQLAESIAQLLKPTGKASLVYPFESIEELSKEFEEVHLKLSRKTLVYPTNKKPAKRVLAEYVHQENWTQMQESSIVIEPEQRHQYSEEYKQITKDFYLKL